MKPDAGFIDAAQAGGSRITLTRDAAEAVAGADIVVTDTWVSMGQDHAHNKIAAMMPYQVNERLMAAAKPDAKFLHCLPAHRGEEATDAVLDGAQSLIWDEAENRLHAQKSILLWCFGHVVMASQPMTFPTSHCAFPFPTCMRAGGWCGWMRCWTTSCRRMPIRRWSKRLLAEALVLTALAWRDAERCRGPIDVAGADRKWRDFACWSAIIKDGALRGYAQFDAAGSPNCRPMRRFFGLFGKGYLAITFDRELPVGEGGGRYQGIVPLGGRKPVRGGDQLFCAIRTNPDAYSRRGRSCRTGACSPAAS